MCTDMTQPSIAGPGRAGWAALLGQTHTFTSGGWRWLEVGGVGTLASVTSGWPQPSTGQVTGHDNNTNHHLHMSEPLHCTWARSHRSRVISGNTTPPALLCHHQLPLILGDTCWLPTCRDLSHYFKAWCNYYFLERSS